MGFLPWGVGQAVIALHTTVPSAVFWFGITLVGIATVPVGWFLFAISYTGRDDWLDGRHVQCLWAISAVFVLLAFLNPADLVFVDPHVDAEGLTFEWGHVALAYFSYVYVLLAVAQALLLSKALRSRNVYRRRSSFFVLIGLLLWISHLIGLAGVVPGPRQALTSLTFLAIGICSLLVINNEQFLKLLPIDPVLDLAGSRFEDITPIARDLVIEEMGSGVVVLDAKNRIVDLNPVAREMLGSDDRRVVGKDIGDMVDLDTFLDEPAFLDPDVTNGHFPEVWVESPDGGRRCYDVVISDLTKVRNDAAGHVALIHDVTETQRRKRQLERQASELERQNEQLEAFAGIVSHDLRNPLNVAQGNVSIALETGELEYLETAQRAHERIDDIITDILRLARQGRSIDERAPVELRSLVRRSWENVDMRDAVLEVTVDDESTIEADETRLMQLFENLFRNAVEHGMQRNDGHDAHRDAEETRSTRRDTASARTVGEHGDAPLTVTVGEFDDGFFVADDGRGIPEDKRDQVLEKGFTTSDGGTGFGLSIVKTIVEAHGWQIRVVESDGGGARFEITIDHDA